MLTAERSLESIKFSVGAGMSQCLDDIPDLRNDTRKCSGTDSLNKMYKFGTARWLVASDQQPAAALST